MTESLPGRVAGVDFGTVRIGVAISDPMRTLASPFANYTRRTPELDARQFRTWVEEERIQRFVVGLPVHLAGHESAKSLEARAFAQWLQAETGVPVLLWDERFTSAQAEELLGAAQFTKRKRKKRLDMVAAQILLAGYLEAGCPDDPLPPGSLG